MPKFRLPTSDFDDFAKTKTTTYFAFDTKEVIAWNLDDSKTLELWFKGASEPVCLEQQHVGEDNFTLVMELLAHEFPHIAEIQLATVSA